MTALLTSSPQAITYIQDGGSGEELKRLPEDSEVTGYSGGGAAFESDYTADEYQGTRITANRGRFTFDLSARRVVASMLREQFGHSRLFNLYVLETDKDGQINGFADFREGQIFIDTGITNESVNAAVVVGTGQADPGARDVLSLSAGTRVEIRQCTLQVSDDSAAGVLESFADAIYVPPFNRADPRDKGLVFAVGQLAGDPIAPDACVGVNADLGVGPWESVPNTGIAADEAAERIIYNQNHLFMATVDLGNIYHLYIANLKNYGTANFRWNEVFGIPAVISGMPRLIAPGNNVVVLQYEDDLYVSTDGGYSFAVNVSGLSFVNDGDACAIDENNIFWVNNVSNTISHVRNLSTVRAITVPGSGTLTAVAVPRRGFELFAADDDGILYRTADISANVPVFEVVSRELTPGVEIARMAFTGARGAVLVIVERNTPNDARLLLDYSGGYGRFTVVPLTADFPLEAGGSDTRPRLVAINPNHILTFGNASGGGTQIGIARG